MLSEVNLWDLLENQCHVVSLDTSAFRSLLGELQEKQSWQQIPICWQIVHPSISTRATYLKIGFPLLASHAVHTAHSLSN